MKDLYERFVIFTQSSFKKEIKKELYDFIWKHYSKKISFYISNLISSSHPNFEDLVQEVMIKIYNNLHTFNPIHSFKAWLYTIARNHCIDFIKNKSNKTHSSREIEFDQIYAENNPEEIIIQDDLLSKIDQFMNSLDGTDREIAYLKLYENLKYQHISRIMDMNVNTVKSKVRSIKQKIRKRLKI